MDRNKHQWIIFIQCQNPKDNILSTFGSSEFTKNEITTLAIDNKTRLWVGTYGQGLCRYNDETEAFTKIISNLLSNALKYAKSTIRITTTEKDSEIVVTVTDDGIGITDQEKTKIFDAFYQVKNNSEINKLGIGIGLHMTRSLVQLMNVRKVKSKVLLA